MKSVPLKNKHKDSVLLKGPCINALCDITKGTDIGLSTLLLCSSLVITSSVFPLALYLFVLIFIIGNRCSVSLGVSFSFRDCFSCVAY